MRSTAFQDRMIRLALAAMLLLCLLPTVNRLLASHEATSGSVWTQICTMAGLKLVQLPFDDVDPATPQPTGGDQPVDCPYCPLLQAIAAFMLWLVFAYLQPLARIIPAPRVLLRLGGHPTGLGSRGPPIAL